MTINETKDIFNDAGGIDKTLRYSGPATARLSRKRIRATSYQRDELFRGMSDGKISVFTDYPSPRVPHRAGTDNGDADIASCLKKCDTSHKYRVQAGRKEIRRYYSLKEIIEKWWRRRAIFSITDLHIRNTRIEKYIDPAKLSTFNLYYECDDPVASLEMMTMVISTRGNITDSHTDDSDGSNHCFVGKKLWLAWDTHEGLARGLQDVERVTVHGKARFDMETFLSLRSSRWFTVEDGQTLFLPGHLTHKVITLENYIGVGSFYVSFPNCLRTLSRWLIHPPNWEMYESDPKNQFLIGNMVDALINGYDREAAKKRGDDPRGVAYLPYSLRAWQRQYPAATRRRLLQNQWFRGCYDIAASAQVGLSDGAR